MEIGLVGLVFQEFLDNGMSVGGGGRESERGERLSGGSRSSLSEDGSGRHGCNEVDDVHYSRFFSL